MPNLLEIVKYTGKYNQKGETEETLQQTDNSVGECVNRPLIATKNKIRGLYRAHQYPGTDNSHCFF